MLIYYAINFYRRTHENVCCCGVYQFQCLLLYKFISHDVLLSPVKRKTAASALARRNAKVFSIFARLLKKKLVLSSHLELTIRALVSQSNWKYCNCRLFDSYGKSRRFSQRLNNLMPETVANIFEHYCCLLLFLGSKFSHLYVQLDSLCRHLSSTSRSFTSNYKNSKFDGHSLKIQLRKYV